VDVVGNIGLRKREKGPLREGERALEAQGVEPTYSTTVIRRLRTRLRDRDRPRGSRHT